MNELIEAFNGAGVRYLLIGGQAMRLTGMPRFSMDWGGCSATRCGEFHQAQSNPGRRTGCSDCPIGGERGENFIQTYQTRWGVVQFHLGLPGVPKFDEAEASSVRRKSETGVFVKCLSGLQLLAAKRAAGRPQDQADITFLEELQRLGKLS